MQYQWHWPLSHRPLTKSSMSRSCTADPNYMFFIWQISVIILCWNVDGTRVNETWETASETFTSLWLSVPNPFFHAKAARLYYQMLQCYQKHPSPSCMKWLNIVKKKIWTSYPPMPSTINLPWKEHKPGEWTITALANNFKKATQQTETTRLSRKMKGDTTQESNDSHKISRHGAE